MIHFPRHYGFPQIKMIHFPRHYDFPPNHHTRYALCLTTGRGLEESAGCKNCDYFKIKEK